MGEVVRHTYVVDAASEGGVRAVCTCGWKSQPVAAAGLAGAVWDEHSQESHRDRV